MLGSSHGDTFASATNVIVVGAGIVGVATALNLLRAGRSVTLIDRQAPGKGTSFGSGGILASSSIVPLTMPGLIWKAPGMLVKSNGPLYLRWSYLLRLMPWLLHYLQHCRADETRRIATALAPLVVDSLDEHRRLAKGTAAENRIHSKAYAVVYRDRAAFAADAFAWYLRKENGITWRTVEGEAVAELEPSLNSAYRYLAIFDHQHGTIDEPGEYIKDLARAFVAEGGCLEQREVKALIRNADGRVALCTDGQNLEADHIIIATGAWSGRLLASIGVNIPLESQRGYHIELLNPSTTINNAMLLADAKCVVTTMSGKLRLAGLLEFGGLDAKPSQMPIRTLIALISRMFPKLTFEQHTEWMGHRPALPDSLPVIGAVPGYSGLLAAFGHHHVGITSGPKTGRLMANLITGRQSQLDMSPYQVSRFGSTSLC
jgi:D-amino-acid dehydrogenase